MTLQQAHSSRVRSPLFNFALGIAIGAAVGAAAAAHVCTRHAQHQADELASGFARLTHDREEQVTSMVQELQQRAQACEERVKRSDFLAASDAQWYTVLYEADTSAAPNAADVAKVLDPRLGAILGALINNQVVPSPGAPNRVTIRWILPGHGMPLVAPPHSRIGTYTLAELSQAPQAVVQ